MPLPDPEHLREDLHSYRSVSRLIHPVSINRGQGPTDSTNASRSAAFRETCPESPGVHCATLQVALLMKTARPRTEITNVAICTGALDRACSESVDAAAA